MPKKERPKPSPSLKAAIDYCGSPTGLATAMGESKQLVDSWLSRGWISTDYALDVEAATDRHVTIHKILLDAKKAKPAKVARGAQ